jgi:hypothetical protein
METPRLLSEYVAARAQSAGWISARALTDAANRSKTVSRPAVSLLERTLPSVLDAHCHTNIAEKTSNLGSTRVAPKQSCNERCMGIEQKVRDREDTIANTRDARTPQIRMPDAIAVF